jgi:hypothetical protein
LKIKLFDVVALTENLPDACLQIGQVGTIVEVYENNVFEVEFCNVKGQAYALETLNASQLMNLHYKPVKKAA